MELRLGAQRQSVARARHWVASHARDDGVPDRLIPLIELLTSELVANAVQHGPADGEVTVRAERADGHFRVLVTDEGGGRPVVRTTPPDVPGGQGMRIVDRLASAWGVEVGPPGTAVWFRVRL